MLSIETENTIFEVEFNHFQFNITSRCDLSCLHCRGVNHGNGDLEIEQLENFLLFCAMNSSRKSNYLISGGEPLQHNDFERFLSSFVDKISTESILTITTNGNTVNKEFCCFLSDINVQKIQISVSLDSVYEDKHNYIRQNSNSFMKAIEAIKLISSNRNTECQVRTTVLPENANDLFGLADMLEKYGVETLSISSIIPSGRGKTCNLLYDDPKMFLNLLKIVKKLNDQKRKMKIIFNDPLYDALISEHCNEDDINYGGCIAGITGITLESNGDLLVCPYIKDSPIMNINGLSVAEITDSCINSSFVHSLVERNLNGKCGQCEKKYFCGGCRARAGAFTKDYLSEDPLCCFNSIQLITS